MPVTSRSWRHRSDQGVHGGIEVFGDFALLPAGEDDASVDDGSPYIAGARGENRRGRTRSGPGGVPRHGVQSDQVGPHPNPNRADIGISHARDWSGRALPAGTYPAVFTLSGGLFFT
ncbi:hypothetical protein [Amycolatopsis pigmentata]|uniref:Uncharacterized protein n=1 Tax=Amycolatopsis pigmentata TaxID=450801 RepID=A0ABW5FMR4_9PSEU